MSVAIAPEQPQPPARRLTAGARSLFTSVPPSAASSLYPYR